MPRQDVLPLQVFFALFELQLQLQSARVYFTNLVSLFCLSVYVAFPYSHSQTVDSDAPPPFIAKYASPFTCVRRTSRVPWCCKNTIT